MVKLTTLLCVAGLAGLAGSARADTTAKTEARGHIDKASQLHKDGKYQQAVDELTIAYSLDPQPDLLYAIAQVHVKLGRCTVAVAFYERFLATKPDEGPAGAAHEAIVACKQRGDTPPPPDHPAEPQPPAPPVTQPPPPALASSAVDTPGDGVWYRDTIGDSLVGGGVLVAIMGGVVYGAARGKLDDADAAKTYTAQQDLVDKAHSERAFSIALVVTGAALIGAGVYHYTRYAETAQQIAVVPTHGGAFASFAMRF